MGARGWTAFVAALTLVFTLGSSTDLVAQDVALRDLVLVDQNVPRRLVGYGLVVGLDGTGDRTVSNFSGGQTVRSVANLLRRFDIEIPPEVLRTRNVAAVLVTAEVSPYLRSGGRFEVRVASMGDATSLRGGVLWMTPLTSDLTGTAVATAQGTLMMSEGSTGVGMSYTVETSGRIPGGGVLEIDMPVPSFTDAGRLLLKEPSLTTALRVAEAINQSVGDGTAAVEDPGSIRLTLPQGDAAAAAETLGAIQELRVAAEQQARLVIDGRDGTVVAGGDMQIGEAVVSHGGMTLSISQAAQGAPGEGEVRVAPGTQVQDVASALHAVGASPSSIAAIFSALREVGALPGEVRIR